MYIVKNAFKNLGRHKRRYFLQGIIVFLLLLGFCVSIIIGDTLNVIIEDYGSRFQINASLDPDYMSLFQKGRLDDFQELKMEELQRIAKSPYVKKVYTSTELAVFAKNIKAIGEDNVTKLPAGMKEQRVDIGEKGTVSCNMLLKGYDDVTKLTDFINNTRKLTEGRYYQKKDECIVSSELAKKNNLKTGDIIKVHGNRQKKFFPLKIVGIYLDVKPINKNMEDPTANCRNEILTNCDTISSNVKSNMYASYATYQLESAEKVDQFERYLSNQGILESYKLTTNKAEYEKIVNPVKKLGSMIKIFQIIMAVCGVIILMVISVIAIQERTYELGVLRSRGMKKGKLMIQFVLENIMLVMICLILGLGISAGIAEPLSNNMLKQQMEVVEKQRLEESANQNKMNGSNAMMAEFIETATSYGDNTNLKKIDQISIQFTFIVIIKIISIALAIGILASITGVRAILRYEPSQILANRN